MRIQASREKFQGKTDKAKNSQKLFLYRANTVPFKNGKGVNQFPFSKQTRELSWIRKELVIFGTVLFKNLKNPKEPSFGLFWHCGNDSETIP